MAAELVIMVTQQQSLSWRTHTLTHTHTRAHSASLGSSSLDYCWQHTALTSSPKHRASKCDGEVQTVSLFGYRKDSRHVTNVAPLASKRDTMKKITTVEHWSCQTQSPVKYSKQLPPHGRSLRISPFLGYAPKTQSNCTRVMNQMS